MIAEVGRTFLVFVLAFESHGLVTSGAAVGGGRRPLPVPRSCGTGPGAPPPTAAEVAQTFRQSLQNKHKECPAGFVSIILNILIPTKKWGSSCHPTWLDLTGSDDRMRYLLQH